MCIGQVLSSKYDKNVDKEGGVSNNAGNGACLFVKFEGRVTSKLERLFVSFILIYWNHYKIWGDNDKFVPKDKYFGYLGAEETRYASLRKTDFSCNKALIKDRSFEQNTD